MLIQSAPGNMQGALFVFFHKAMFDFNVGSFITFLLFGSLYFAF